MTLENGTYIIINQLTKGPIGGAEQVGDLSKVISLPGGVRPPLWKLTKERDGLYRLTQEPGAPVEIDRLLFLSDRDEDKDRATWKVEHVPQQGRNAYIITNAKSDGPSSGWVVTDYELYTQVAVRPLIVFPTYPPRYPPGEVFDIVRVNSDDDAN
ncbi:hypothetical protein EST38_g5922 [Candolleomyces aberdarensis]|uniref:Serine protease inhibitor n=1 Tax=Candolleomyces aberdarensis TaxID=2316362 RepID=A0A4Q2DJ68_9AGAR|nr:hypothetical protein EST38_g5922 [Candolleomyces aberdarensis]